jgi:enamine deaminase RidA (YjgF/YER057c/UK114 family)
MTFERGTAVTYGDRTHLYLSGTASIDAEGKVLFEEDVERQTERALENVMALLVAGGTQLGDLHQLTAYVRRVEDGSTVGAILRRRLPSQVPFIVVRGEVCRRQWLVEIEGIAVVAGGEPRYPAYA